MWDVEAAVREIEWARSAGLRAIYFPAYQSWLLPYNDLSWELIWSAAEAFEMPLVTHLGGGAEVEYMVNGAREIRVFEDTIINGKRMLPWLVYSGVFERHPRLKVVITEVPGYWWTQWMKDLDSNLGRTQSPSEGRHREPHLPSTAERIHQGTSLRRCELHEPDAGRDGIRGGVLVELHVGVGLPARRGHVPLSRLMGRPAAHEDRPEQHIS